MASQPERVDAAPYARHFVWGTWILLTLAAMLFVTAYGSAVPRWEDWFHIPFITGQRQLDARWLWEPMSEHRVPILKLLMYYDFRWFGLNVRPVLFLNVGLFSILAAMLLWGVGKVRGHAVYTDAFFPIILLNIGQGDGFLWAGTTVYVLTTVLVGLILVTLLVGGSNFTIGSSCVVGVCLVMLPLCFGGGLIFAGCLGSWIAFRGLCQIRSEDRTNRVAGWIALGFIAVLAVIGAVYFVNYKITHTDTAATPVARTPSAVIEVTLKFLSMGLGMAANPPIWPISGWAVLILLAFGGWCFRWILRSRGDEQRRAMGVAWVLCSSLAVALVTGWGRVSCGTDYLFNSRYAASAAPALLAIYCLCEVIAPSGARSLVRMVLFTVAASCFMLNLKSGAELAQKQNDDATAFLLDVHASMAIPELASRHAPITYYYHEQLVQYLQLLRDHQFGDYARLPADPVFQTELLPLTPSSTQQVQWQAPDGKATGDAPCLIFDLKQPRFVCGVKIRYSNRNRWHVSPLFRFHWTLKPEEEFSAAHSYKHYMLPSDGSEVEISTYIYGMVSKIRIQPDKGPCDFTIRSIELLLEPQAPATPR